MSDTQGHTARGTHHMHAHTEESGPRCALPYVFLANLCAYCIRRSRPPGALDGASLSLPINEAWASLLDNWLPCLLEECQAACAFMVLYRDRRSQELAVLSAAASKTGALTRCTDKLIECTAISTVCRRG